MNQAIIIDATAANRAPLIQQLQSIQPYQIHQYRDVNEAQKLLGRPVVYTGLIFLNWSASVAPLMDFVQELRQYNQEACLIVLVSHVTLEDMRVLMPLGIDQILLRPFTMKQLKDKIAAAELFRLQVKSENLLKPQDSTFEAKTEMITEKFYKVHLAGWLSDNCILPEIKPAEGNDSTLFIKCDYLRGITSVGTRAWLLWLKMLGAAGFFRFELENLHPQILMQASSVPGFIPTNGSINSFYLMYWCPATNEEREFKFVRGKDYATDQMRIPEEIEATQSGKTQIYELDNSVERHLKFFKGSIEFIKRIKVE